MPTNNATAPKDQSVTFIELFFDLVFVFSITQVVFLLHHELNWIGVGQSILVFWLVWWAWTQFTWALNAADSTNTLVEIGTLAATAVAFFMAVTLPDAFHGHALAFAIPYILVRLIGLALYIWVASADASQSAAVRKFALMSIGGLAAVLVGGLLGGVMGGVLQYLFWGLAIVLDVMAASGGGRAEGWNLHPEHFSERHGLIVIIALGETLIVAAGGVTGAEWTNELIMVTTLIVLTSCALWWSYFPRAKPMLDAALEAASSSARSGMARDVYSLLHFPMLCGVIAYAVVVEEIIAHPHDSLPLVGRLALAIGLALFVGGMAVAVWRATGRILLPRIILSIIAIILILTLTGVAPILSLAITLGTVVIIAIVEQLFGQNSQTKERSELTVE